VTLTKGPPEFLGKMFLGIYLLEDDTLKVVFRDPGQPRPSEFVTEGKTGIYKVFFKRVGR
jgi:uncharacterized protein (TIGR03067 family)